MSTDTPSNGNHTNRISAADVKRAASGRWLEILQAAGLPSELLDGRGHPCPKCPEPGTKRFTVFPDVEQTGGVMCRHCFNEKNGDGLAAVQWLRGCSFPDAVAFVADVLDIQVADRVERAPSDIVADVARAKRMPLDAFRQFGAEPAKRGKATVARVPVWNERGEVHSYVDLTPEGKGWFKRGKGNSGLFFPGRLPREGETWVLVEGVKDAAALTGLGYQAAGLPRNELAAKYARLFSGCDLVIVPDLDVPGTTGAQRTAGRLAGVASTVRIARLPGEILKSGGDDVRDVLKKHGAATVRAATDDAALWQASEGETDGERPEVLITLDEAAVADIVLNNLAALGRGSRWLRHELAERCRLYQRGGVLVHVVCDARPESSGITLPEPLPQIRTLPKPLVRERITQAVRLMAEETRGEDVVLVPKRPPEWLVQAIHQRGEFGPVLKLAGITRTPTLRPDGSILQAAGYDARTGLLYSPECEFPAVPDQPTQADAARAAVELLDVISDFPLVDVHKSVWLSLVLTLLARPAINGPCPLFAFDANTRGAGKTLLADVAGIIAHGSAMARNSWPSSNEEVRKVITSVVLEAWPAVLFDNVSTVLGGSALDAALTGTSWQDRILKESKTTGLLPLTTIWVASGNNLELSADTARRTLLARLESLEEHPEDRTGFRHPDLKAFVRSERPRLAVAGLTILRAFFVAGCPDMKLPPWGSFEAWSDLVRKAIVWAGQPDPWLMRDAVRDADRTAELVRLIHAGIEEADVNCDGVTAADIVRLLGHEVELDGVDQWPILRAAMTELCGAKIDSRRIGYRLRKYRGRVCAGRRLTSHKGHGGVQRWTVEPVYSNPPAGGDGADGGDDSPHSEETISETAQTAGVITYEL